MGTARRELAPAQPLMSHNLIGTAAADGFFMPAEWSTHAATWMIWPERLDNWREHGRPAQRAFVEIAGIISSFEPLCMLVSPAQLPHAKRMLPAAVTLVPQQSDDAWCRDTGPTFLTNETGTVRAVQWRFNAWGGLYSPWNNDQQVAPAICQSAGVDYYRAPLILEGGSVHVDGEGTVLVTEQCLLNPNRNPQLSRADIESQLRSFLGVTKVLWLGAGVVNDETDGHIDNLACFIRPGVVALAGCDDPMDPQFAVARDAEQRLCGTRPTPWVGHCGWCCCRCRARCICRRTRRPELLTPRHPRVCESRV